MTLLADTIPVTLAAPDRNASLFLAFVSFLFSLLSSFSCSLYDEQQHIKQCLALKATKISLPMPHDVASDMTSDFNQPFLNSFFNQPTVFLLHN